MKKNKQKKVKDKIKQFVHEKKSPECLLLHF